METTLLRGIYPVLTIPFDQNGRIDETSLRRVARFEMEGGIQGIGVGGFASEAYKLTDSERIRCAEIVVEETGGHLPLIIGMSPGSTEAAIEQSRLYAQFQPAALMTLPPNIMNNGEQALVDHYVALAEASPVPIMVQQSPHIQGYSESGLEPEALAQIAARSAKVRYFKIEGPGSAQRIATLRQHVGEGVALFGGVGGIALKDELKAGAAGLLPGVGFNEYFVRVWQAWEAGNFVEAEAILNEAQPLVDAVSSSGHEFSLHARKYLLQRAGIIDCSYVRRPTVQPENQTLEALAGLVDSLPLRIAVKPSNSDFNVDLRRVGI